MSESEEAFQLEYLNDYLWSKKEIKKYTKEHQVQIILRKCSAL